MSDEERIELSERLDRGLQLAYERMLRQKILLGQSIVVGDKDGNAKEITAQEALDSFLKSKSQ